MEAENKLQGAAYHLDRMKELYLKNEKLFTYELEAFLTKIRSVLDVMLEDFNRKMNLGISLEEKLFPLDFERKATKLKNTEALNFIKWWKNQIRAIETSSTGPLLKMAHK